mmetsp:Transcript_118985/g.381247  ORF Transcript_118985/g.381247 Transcript_118985/m.381247 type:complete len:465 (-) Transcript_118985:253-1647(-)
MFSCSFRSGGAIRTPVAFSTSLRFIPSISTFASWASLTDTSLPDLRQALKKLSMAVQHFNAMFCALGSLPACFSVTWNGIALQVASSVHRHSNLTAAFGLPRSLTLKTLPPEVACATAPLDDEDEATAEAAAGAPLDDAAADDDADADPVAPATVGGGPDAAAVTCGCFFVFSFFIFSPVVSRLASWDNVKSFEALHAIVLAVLCAGAGAGDATGAGGADDDDASSEEGAKISSSNSSGSRNSFGSKGANHGSISGSAAAEGCAASLLPGAAGAFLAAAFVAPEAEETTRRVFGGGAAAAMADFAMSSSRSVVASCLAIPPATIPKQTMRMMRMASSLDPALNSVHCIGKPTCMVARLPTFPVCHLTRRQTSCPSGASSAAQPAGAGGEAAADAGGGDAAAGAGGDAAAGARCAGDGAEDDEDPPPPDGAPAADGMASSTCAVLGCRTGNASSRRAQAGGCTAV